MLFKSMHFSLVPIHNGTVRLDGYYFALKCRDSLTWSEKSIDLMCETPRHQTLRAGGSLLRRNSLDSQAEVRETGASYGFLT